MDNVNRYVVTTRSSEYYQQDYIEKHMIEMYSAQDAVDAVRTWLGRQGMHIGGTRTTSVTHVEPYNEALHGQWLVQRGGPGRSV